MATVLLLALSTVSPAGASSSPDLRSAEKKLDHIQSNGRSPNPSQTPTVVSEQEMNAYLASDHVRLPAGVEKVMLEGLNGGVTGRTRVDFDRVREGIHSSNPLLSVFTGVHEVVVVTHAHGKGGRGYVHVDSVSLDNVEVPRFLLEMFVEKFLKPKYPNLGLDSEFELPDRIDRAEVGEHEITLFQK
ncbi:MAG: hypothetical protein J2P13_07705 [Acidobacteria bacterium]|nr:hypothetical protein [Acidobacteriota bacterium]